jgi:HlyD family secretion protein
LVKRSQLLGAALLSTVLVGCSGGDAPDVRTAVIERATVEEVVDAPGAVAARATATLTAPASGRVAKIEVTAGETVTTGQVLLRIDSPEAEARLEQAQEADAEAARAGQVDLGDAPAGTDLSAEQAEADAAAAESFARARESAQKIPDGPAQAQALAAVDAAQAQYDAARAQAREAVRRFNAGLGSLTEALGSLGDAQRVQTGAAVAVARDTVEALTVVAPIDGVVSLGDRGQDGRGGVPGLDQLPEDLAGQAGALLGSGGGASVEGTLAVGTPVSAGDVLLTVTDVSTLTLTAEVDETDVLLVEPGVEAQAELDAVPGATYASTVATVDVTPTTSARGGVAYVVRLSLGAGRMADGRPAPVPKAGMSAVVSLHVRTAENAVAAPVAAVFRDGERDAVWLVRGGVAEKRLVLVGAAGQDVVEVVEGLDAGDRVVVGGADLITEGQRIDDPA